MNLAVSHELSEESIESKALWFAGLPLDERMALLCDFTELALEINPNLPDHKDAEQTRLGIQIISLP